MSLYDSKELDLRDIDIYHCSNCGHTQIPAQISEDYYEDYSMGSFWGDSFRRIREQQIERLARLVPAPRRFLDIGCGVGHYLELASKKFDEVYGVDPSLSSALAARERGFSVINDYFHGGLIFESGFDAISIIEVLEHVEQPEVLLSHAAGFLNDNGILLVEVPNGQRILEKRLYYNLCTDHLHYFSVSSLTALANRIGLTVICSQESSDPNLLEIYIKKVSKPTITFTNRRNIAIELMISKLSPGACIAAWGAGAESASFLAMLNGEINIKCIFDSDQAKHGHSIGGIPIIKPASLEIHKFDTIILFANAHKKQIQNQLGELGFKGRLLLFT